MENSQKSNRLQSIDIVRGFVMVIMAIDHVRDYFSSTSYRPDDVTQASASLFLTRWITHLCAPTFIFLSGVSIYLYAKKAGNTGKTSFYLLTRGLWLVVLEIFVISFIMTQGYDMTVLSIIWAIGCSMIFLAALIWLPRWLQAIIAIVLIASHGTLLMTANVTADNMLIAFLHNTPFFIAKPPVLVAYTIIPWVAVMLLGYAIGPWFTYETGRRNKLLVTSGLIAIAIFLVLRLMNNYGDPEPWNTQDRGWIYSVMSFFKISKYPPSLLFLSITLGISFILLTVAERLPFKVKDVLITYGRVPLFYFVAHLVLISVASYIWTYLAFGKGYNLSFMSPKDWPAEYHPSLLRLYFVWLLLVVALYLPCKWYGNYKLKNRTWWTTYL